MNAPMDLLKPTSFDRVWSWLTATLVVAGFGVVLMFCVWLTTGGRWIRENSSSGLVGFGVPSESSLPALSAEQQEFTEVPPSELPLEPEQMLESAMQAVSQVVSERSEALDGLGGIGASKKKPGDPREKGPSDQARDLTPRWERWRLQFSTSDLKSYARQLDHLGIELGAAGGGRAKIDYASKLASEKPRQRQGEGKSEKRLYMTWKSGQLRAFDKQLLEQAGIPVRGRVQLQFLSKELEQTLAQLELEAAKGKDVALIKRTVFSTRPSQGGYELYVKHVELKKQGSQ